MYVCQSVCMYFCMNVCCFGLLKSSTYTFNIRPLHMHLMGHGTGNPLCGSESKACRSQRVWLWMIHQWHSELFTCTKPKCEICNIMGSMRNFPFSQGSTAIICLDPVSNQLPNIVNNGSNNSQTQLKLLNTINIYLE